MNEETARKLLESFNSHSCSMLTEAEQAMFAGDKEREFHFATCARQWFNAIAELEEAMKKQ